MGSRDGLTGWKLVKRRDGHWLGEGIDGRSVEFAGYPRPYQAYLPNAMLDQPGGKSHWVFTDSGFVIDTESKLSIADFSNTRTSYCQGQPIQIPRLFLHLLKVRHPASSKKLRQLKLADAKNLFAAGEAHHHQLRSKLLKTENKKKQSQDTERGTETASDTVIAQDAVRGVLPSAPEKLIEGVARIARLAAEAKIELTKLTAKLGQKEGVGDAGEFASAKEIRISEGLGQLKIPAPGIGYWRHGSSSSGSQHLRETAKFLKGERQEEVASCDTAWFNLLHNLPAIAWRSFWKLATAEDDHASVAMRIRQPWLDTLELIAELGILDLPGGFRTYSAVRPNAKDKKEKARRSWLQGENRYLGYEYSRHPQSAHHILEYTPSGKFQPPEGYDVENMSNEPIGWTGAQLKQFIETARAMEELPFATPEQVTQAAEKLGVTPVEVAVTWMGDVRTVNWGNDKLTKEIRSFYGWKVKPVQEAIATLEASPLEDSVVAAPLYDDPTGPLTGDRVAAFDKMVAQWEATRAGTFRISPDLISAFEKSTHRYYNAPTEELIRIYDQRADADLVRSRKLDFKLDAAKSYNAISLDYSPNIDHEYDRLLERTVFSIYLFNYLTVAGDPIRSVLPELVSALRDWLDNESTLLPFGLRPAFAASGWPLSTIRERPVFTRDLRKWWPLPECLWPPSAPRTSPAGSAIRFVEMPRRQAARRRPRPRLAEPPPDEQRETTD